jgi:hypothetical protein
MDALLVRFLAYRLVFRSDAVLGAGHRFPVADERSGLLLTDVVIEVFEKEFLNEELGEFLRQAGGIEPETCNGTYSSRSSSATWPRT